jgi:hypothetical protein
MAFAVGADEENKLVGIPLGARGTVHGVATEPGDAKTMSAHGSSRSASGGRGSVIRF